jgi:hypothetical protein
MIDGLFFSAGFSLNGRRSIRGFAFLAIAGLRLLLGCAEDDRGEAPASLNEESERRVNKTN